MSLTFFVIDFGCALLNIILSVSIQSLFSFSFSGYFDSFSIYVELYQSYFNIPCSVYSLMVVSKLDYLKNNNFGVLPSRLRSKALFHLIYDYS